MQNVNSRPPKQCANFHSFSFWIPAENCKKISRFHLGLIMTFDLLVDGKSGDLQSQENVSSGNHCLYEISQQQARHLSLDQSGGPTSSTTLLSLDIFIFIYHIFIFSTDVNDVVNTSTKFSTPIVENVSLTEHSTFNQVKKK